jgi:hypothetical protein
LIAFANAARRSSNWDGSAAAALKLLPSCYIAGIRP